MVDTKKLIKSLSVITFLGISNITQANDCKPAVSLGFANSFVTQVGSISSNKAIVKGNLAFNCSNFKAYAGIIQQINGKTDRSLIGALGILPIKNSPLSLRLGIENLHIYKKQLDIPRLRYGATLKVSNIFNLDLDHFKFLDGSKKHFTEINLSKKFRLDKDLSLSTKLGVTFNKGFSLDDRYYGEVGINYKLNKSTSLFLNYQKQLEPINTEQFGLKLNYTF